MIDEKQIIVYSGYPCRIIKQFKNGEYLDLKTIGKTEKMITETFLSVPKEDIGGRLEMFTNEFSNELMQEMQKYLTELGNKFGIIFNNGRYNLKDAKIEYQINAHIVPKEIDFTVPNAMQRLRAAEDWNKNYLKYGFCKNDLFRICQVDDHMVRILGLKSNNQINTVLVEYTDDSLDYIEHKKIKKSLESLNNGKF